MLGCCHCLCSKEYNAYSRVAACYPADNRPDPVAARVRELINWGIHDVSRFSKIHEIISERVRQDIQRDQFNSSAVGVKILTRLLENVRDLNHPLSSALTTSILQLIQTRKQQFLELASEASESLKRFTLHHQIQVPVQRIFRAYIPLCSVEDLSDIAFNSISSLIENDLSVECIPMDELLGAIKDQLSTNNAARGVLVSIAHAATPLTLPKMRDILISFFDEQHLWNDLPFLFFFMNVLFSEMKDNCSPPFFRLWLELLPPRSSDNGHCRAVITVSLHLMEELPSTRLLVATNIDPLLMVFYFVLKLPQLTYEDRESILESAFTLGHSMATIFSSTEYVQVAHRQIWNALPIGEENSTDYDVEPIVLIFKFASIFTSATAKSLTKTMIRDSLGRVLKFLINFNDHQEQIYNSILEHLKSLDNSYKFSKNECIIPFLLALQKELKKRNEQPNFLALHTFILCAMKDATDEGPQLLKEYVAKIAKKRLRAKPPMIDITLGFVKQYFKHVRKIPFSNTRPATVEKFKRKKVMAKTSELRHRSMSMKRMMTDMVIIKDKPSPLSFDEEEEYDEALLFDETIRSYVNPLAANNDEESEFSELPEELDAAIKHETLKQSRKVENLSSIATLQFENKSTLSQL